MQLTVTYNTESLFSRCRNDGDVTNQSAGVYVIPIVDTSKINTDTFYVGSTKRVLSTRCKEHYADLKFGRTSTALSRWCLDGKGIPLWEGARIIATQRTECQIRILEAIYIYITRHDNCNDSVALQLPFPWREMLNNTERPKFLKMLLDNCTRS